jgi:hypothetical protein
VTSILDIATGLAMGFAFIVFLDYCLGRPDREIRRLRSAAELARGVLLFRHEACGYIMGDDVKTAIHVIDAALKNPPTEFKTVPEE